MAFCDTRAYQVGLRQPVAELAAYSAGLQVLGARLSAANETGNVDEMRESCAAIIAVVRDMYAIVNDKVTARIDDMERYETDEAWVKAFLAGK